MNKKEIKLNVTVEEAASLYENEIIGRDTVETLLKNFTKEDLIDCILGFEEQEYEEEEQELEDNEDEEQEEEKEYEDVEFKEKEEKPLKETKDLDEDTLGDNFFN